MIVITFVGTFLSALKAAQKTLTAWVKLQKSAFSTNEGGWALLHFCCASGADMQK